MELALGCLLLAVINLTGYIVIIAAHDRINSLNSTIDTLYMRVKDLEEQSHEHTSTSGLRTMLEARD